MITALDTNVVLDVLRGDVLYGHASAAALRKARRQGQVVMCGVVSAEVASLYQSKRDFEDNIEKLGITFSPLTHESAWLAGEYWRRYRTRGGGRKRMIADFLIGAHATLAGRSTADAGSWLLQRLFSGLRSASPART